MTIISKPGGIQEGMISEPRIREQVFPFNNFDHSSEFTTEFLDSSTTIGCGAPTIRMDLQFSDDVSYDIAVENAVLCNPNA